jgi:membrane protease YdiL (CAAX protease family)
MTTVTYHRKFSNGMQVSSIAVCLVLFSFFAQREIGWAFLFLLAAQVLMIISLSPCSGKMLAEIFGIRKGRSLPIWAVISVTTAVAAAGIYRRNLPYTPWPTGLNSFAGIAILIGACEELIFRGFIYTKIPVRNFALKALGSSFIHASYKGALFASFADTRPGWLFLITLITGFLLGLMRNYSKSIIPCIIFHCLFDVMVYGDMTSTPWWVW